MTTNQLAVSVYSSGTTLIDDAAGDLANIENVRFSTGYPGGLYLGASMFVPRDILRSWQIKGMQRFVIRNGLTTVYEGQFTNGFGSWRETSEGVQLNLIGYWGSLLNSRRLRRLYADKRTNEETWKNMTGTDTVAETVNIRRYDQENSNNQLKITPQASVAWGAADRIRLRYTAPTGETIRRIDFDYNFSEGAQVWTSKLYDVDNAADLWTIAATGNAAGQNVEPAAGCATVDFYLTSTNAQTTPADQSIWSELSNIVVYATMNHAPASLATVDFTEIAKDIRAEISDLSADEFEIDSNTLSLVPFIADGFPTVAETLVRCASYGDSSQNEWAVGVLASDLSTDDKPLLFIEQYPALTDYDYAVRMDEPNLKPPTDISRDWDSLHNWIVVQYGDEQGKTQYVTPDDDANLKDADSITDWDQQDHLLKIRHGDVTVATNFGRRYLAKHKSPQWRMTKPIRVRGYIRAKSGNRIPSSEIHAGKRVKIENFLNDLSGTGLTFLITKTDYDDRDEVCAIQAGKPDALDVALAQQTLEMERIAT
jgi:hypothetical protein